jgi:type IV secretory pathway VirB6-like protein
MNVAGSRPSASSSFASFTSLGSTCRSSCNAATHTAADGTAYCSADSCSDTCTQTDGGGTTDDIDNGRTDRTGMVMQSQGVVRTSQVVNEMIKGIVMMIFIAVTVVIAIIIIVMVVFVTIVVVMMVVFVTIVIIVVMVFIIMMMFLAVLPLPFLLLYVFHERVGK